jgi:nitrogen fixation protein NifX
MSLTRRLRVVCSTDGGDEMEQPLRIAFASTDSKRVNQHFGSAKAFSIFAVTPDHAEQIEASEFGHLAQDGNEDKLDTKIEVLQGCSAVYCQAAGPSAIKRLLTIGVQPVKVSEGAEIKSLIRDIQTEMKFGASGWLAKALEKTQKEDDSRFDAMEAEGWDE